jgi:sugar porter (SP) family MFS transporter
MNGLQATAAWKSYFGNPSGSVLGVVNAAQSIGSFVALPFIGILSDKIGRRWTLLAGAITIIIASIIQAAAVDYAMFVVARILVGVGSMLVVQPAPMLITELCYPTHRGKYTSLFWTCYYFGAILAAWTTYGTQKHMNNSNWAWRAPSLVQAGYPIVQVIFWWFLPESPRWLIANHREAEAKAILARFHTGGDESHQLLAFEMEEISRTIELEQQAKATKWSALIATPGNRKRTLIAICVGGFAQWNGVAVVSYYLTLVLDTVGVTNPDTQTLINGILQIFNFASAVSAAFLVDRLGRRTLFIWSGAGMLVSFVVWTACSAVFDINGSKGAGIVVIAFIFVFFFHYDIAYTPLLLGYPTEIFPYSLRSKGLTVELLTVYGSLIILSFVNPIALDNIGWHYYIVFCCLLAVFFVVTFFLFPETKGYSLEEIAEVFDGPSATTHGQNAATTKAGKAENDSDFLESETVHHEVPVKY